MSLEGLEVTARLTGKGAERLAVLLYAVLQDQKKTRGKTRLTAMLKSGKPLKVFSVSEKDLERFSKEAKKYGVLYCLLKDKSRKDGFTDVFVRAEDAGKVNRIFERFGLSTAAMSDIHSEIRREKDGPVKADRDERDIQPQAAAAGAQEESLLDQLLSPEKDQERQKSANPGPGPVAKSGRSGPTSGRQRNSGKRDSSDLDGQGAVGKEERPSVRKELKEIRKEQRQRKAAGKENALPEHRHTVKVKERKGR